jgi:hypothetical protein
MSMAEADDALADWIWLRDARNLATGPLGSKVRAQKLIVRWMAAGNLPWVADEWEGPDAADTAEIDQGVDEYGNVPPIFFTNGDPQFMVHAGIDWKDNMAHARNHGARAEGIKVPRTRLLELLPRVREHMETARPPAPPAAKKDRLKPQKPKGRKKPQVDRILLALHELYPDGGDEMPPPNVVLQKVADHLKTDTKKRGLADPKRDSVDRALRKFRTGK